MADQALADLAAKLRRPNEDMRKRAGWWRNTFNPTTGHQQAHKANGSWVTPFANAAPGCQSSSCSDGVLAVSTGAP